MMYNRTSRTQCTHFPSGLRLAKLRKTSKQHGQIEVGCQISHCETIGSGENLNIGQIICHPNDYDVVVKILRSYRVAQRRETMGSRVQ